MLLLYAVVGPLMSVVEEQPKVLRLSRRRVFFSFAMA